MVKHILADLHTHLLEKKIKSTDWWDAVKEKKLNVVAITEHAEYNPEKAYKILVKNKPKNILLIPGMEARTSAGHLLVYGKDESIYNVEELKEINVPIEKALKAINANGLVASFAHPFGYKTDSVCHTLGESKAIRIARDYKIGSEYYNGMLGSANGFIFGTDWIKKLYNFFDFTEKSRLIKIFGMSNESKKAKDFLEKISNETFERVRRGILFGQNMNYITTGSDAHYPRVIGTAIIELKKQPKDNSDFLKMITKGEILWAGPNIYSNEPVDKLRKKELLQGLKYVTTKKLKNTIKRPRKRVKKKKRLLQIRRLKK